MTPNRRHLQGLEPSHQGPTGAILALVTAFDAVGGSLQDGTGYVSIMDLADALGDDLKAWAEAADVTPILFLVQAINSMVRGGMLKNARSSGVMLPYRAQATADPADTAVRLAVEKEGTWDEA